MHSMMDNPGMYPPSCEPARIQRGVLVFLHQATIFGMVPGITIPLTVLREPRRGDCRLVDELTYALFTYVAFESWHTISAASGAAAEGERIR